MNQNLPASWAQAELQEVARIGPRFEAGALCDDDLVHFVPMAAVAENFGGADVSQLRPLGTVRKGYTSFAEGDVLFAKITPCMENGKGALVPHLSHRHAFGSTEFHVLRPCGALSAKWLAHFVSQPAFRKVARHNMTGTAGQLRVPTKWLQSVQLPIPPRTEQTRIVAKLEELLSDLDAGVAELKAAQKKLQQYRQSLLKAAVEGALTAEWRKAQRANHAPQETGAQLLARILTERRARWEAKQLAKFAEQGKTPPKDWQSKYLEPVAPDTANLPALPEGWVWCSLDALISDGPQNGLYLPADRYGRGTPILRIDDYQIGWHRDQANLKRVDVAEQDSLVYSLQQGDLVINRVNSMTHLGKSLLVPESLSNTVFESNMMRLNLIGDGLISNDFVAYYLGSDIGRTRLTQDAKWAVNQASINQQDVRRTPVPLPPLTEQVAISEQLATQLVAMMSLEDAIDLGKKQSTAQRQNLLRAAFAGQLVPQDPNDEPASVLLDRIRAERAAQANQQQVKKVKKPLARKSQETA